MGNPSIVILLFITLIFSGCNFVGDTEQQGDFFERNRWFGSPASDTATNLSWSEGSAHNAVSVNATWTLSSLSNVSSQQIDYYTDSSCSTPEGTSTALGAAITTDTFTGTDGSTYYFKITTTTDETQNHVSNCSPGILIDTTAPSAATLPLWSQSTPYNGNPTATWAVSASGDVVSQQVNYFSDLCSTGIGNSGILGTGVTSHTFTASDGAHYFQVVSTDAAGNSNISACSPLMTIDKTPPAQATAPTWSEGVPHNTVNVNASWIVSISADVASQEIVYYTNGTCTIPQGTSVTLGAAANLHTLVGANGNTYYYRITTTDVAGNTSLSDCSNPMIIDTVAPIDNIANLQFTASVDDGTDVAVTWTAFTDSNLSDHRIITYTNSACSAGLTNHGLTGSSTNSNATIIDGLTDGTYWATVWAYDSAGNSTISACSTDSIIIDSTPPTDNSANVQFTNAFSSNGVNIAMTWTAFTDTNLSNHRIFTYTDSGCSTGVIDHGLTASTSATDLGIVDGLTDGTYWAKVRAYDIAGNFTDSGCSTDSIIVDMTAPTPGGNLQFTNLYDNDGNLIDVTWTAFTDPNLSDYRLLTYTNSGCTLGETDHGLTGGTTTSNNTIITGLADGTYFAKVRGYDAAGNFNTSTCSTDSITVDTTPPTDNPANAQFTDAIDGDGNDIAITWTAFTDPNLSDHRIVTYTDSGCSGGMVDHGLTGSSTNSNSTIVDGLTNGSYWVKITAYDSAGNFTTSACSTDSIEIDTSAPTVTINQANGESVNICTFATQADPATSLPVEFIVVVSEASLGLTAADFTQNGTATGVVWSLTDCLLSNTYKLTATTASTEGTLVPTLNAAVFTDIVGNSNSASTSTDNSVIYDTGPPTIVSVTSTSPGDGTYGIGTNIDIILTFNEAVTTSTSSLSMATGATATYLSGSGTTQVTYRYTVAPGNSSSDLNVSLFNVGDTVDAASNAANSSLPGLSNLADNQAIIIETIVPTLSSISIASNYNNTSYAKVGDIVTVTFSASETLQATPTVNIDGKAASVSGSGTGPYSATYTMQSGDTEGVLGFTIDFSDLAGNAGTQVTAVTDSTSVTFDETAPTLAPTGLNWTEGSYSSTLTPTANWTVSADGSVVRQRVYFYDNGTCTDPDISSNPLGSMDGTTNDNTTNTMVYPGSPAMTNGGTYSFKVRAYDAAGNLKTSVCSSALVIDQTPPTVTINQKSGQADPSGILPVQFDVVFSEAILPATFTTADITQNGTATGITWNIINSGDNINFTLQATAVTGDGTIIPSIGIGTFTDVAGNSNTAASTSTDNSVTFDSTRTVTLSVTGNAAIAADGSATTTLVANVKSIENANVSGVSVTLNIPGNGGSASSPIVTDAGGNATFTLTSSTFVGTYNYTATAAGVTSSGVNVEFKTAELTWDLTSFDFGTTGAIVTQTFTLTNSGLMTSGTINTNLAGGLTHFSITTDNCIGITLNAASSCTVIIQFDGTSNPPGTKSTTLDATSTPGGSAISTIQGTKL